MSLNSNAIFNRLLSVYKTDKMNELSVLLGYKESWGAATRKRGAIPFDACVLATEKFGISMDSLLFGVENNRTQIEVGELKLATAEGLIYLLQLEMMKPTEGVKISSMADVLVKEISEVLNVSNKKAV